MEDLTLLIERYKQFYNKGFLAQQQGKKDVARINFMHAAEVMYDIAKKSPKNLREVRLEKAKLLIQLAEGVVPNEETPQVNQTQEKVSEASEFKPQVAKEKLTFDDLIGLEEAKHIVKTQMILPLKHPEAYALYKKNTGGGMILYGPPGTGKTTFAKAIANEAQASFFYVKASDILDKYVGESEKKIASLFQAIGSEERSVLFVDDMDSLFMKRGVDHHNDERVNEFLQQMDGFNSTKGQVMLLGATNRPWALDSAITRPGRFSRQVYIGLPNHEARIYLIKKYLEGAPVDQAFDFDDIASKTEHYSGADLRELCEQAKVVPLMNFIEDNENNKEKKVYHITNQDFNEALSHVPSSINLKELEQFDIYRNVRSNPNASKKISDKKVEKENKDSSDQMVLQHDTSIQIPLDHLVSIRFVLSEAIDDQVYLECDTQKYVCQKDLNQWQSDQIYIESSGKKIIQVFVKDTIVGSFEVEFTQGLIEHSLGF
jgi:transitional endoplasmic reticulum ATPase